MYLICNVFCFARLLATLFAVLLITVVVVMPGANYFCACARASPSPNRPRHYPNPLARRL